MQRIIHHIFRLAGTGIIRNDFDHTVNNNTTDKAFDPDLAMTVSNQTLLLSLPFPPLVHVKACPAEQ